MNWILFGHCLAVFDIFCYVDLFNPLVCVENNVVVYYGDYTVIIFCEIACYGESYVIVYGIRSNFYAFWSDGMDSGASS